MDNKEGRQPTINELADSISKTNKRIMESRKYGNLGDLEKANEIYTDINKDVIELLNTTNLNRLDDEDKALVSYFLVRFCDRHLKSNQKHFHRSIFRKHKDLPAIKSFIKKADMLSFVTSHFFDRHSSGFIKRKQLSTITMPSNELQQTILLAEAKRREVDHSFGSMSRLAPTFILQTFSDDKNIYLWMSKDGEKLKSLEEVKTRMQENL